MNLETAPDTGANIGPNSGPNSGMARLMQELREGGVADERVLSVIERTPRGLFVPAPFAAKAFDNVALPIGHHQTVSQPLVVARMTQALDVGERMKVLEVGAGSGYQGAILARLCRRLYAIERYAGLLEEAEKRWARLRISNITALHGDGSLGWPEQAPFDRIMVTAAAADMPPVLLEQLAVGGLMVVPVGDGDHDQRLELVRRTGDGVETEDLGPVRFVPLIDGKAEHL